MLACQFSVMRQEFQTLGAAQKRHHCACGGKAASPRLVKEFDGLGRQKRGGDAATRVSFLASRAARAP
jgi:hypothetical protein